MGEKHEQLIYDVTLNGCLSLTFSTSRMLVRGWASSRQALPLVSMVSAVGEGAAWARERLELDWGKLSYRESERW